MDFIQAENPSLHVVEIHPGQVTETDMAAKVEGLPHIDDGTVFILNFPEHFELTISS